MDDEHPQGFPLPLQLHIPDFVYSSVPTLVPGGGAEVVPLANEGWFVNNGFTPTLAQLDSYPFSTSQFSDEQLLQPQSDAAPFEYVSLPVNPFPASTHSPPPPKAPDLSLFLADPLRRLPAAPSTFGLPVYSASGFDLLSLLTRIANRPNPRIALGPVDLTCSFVVVDVRRYDHPIVYCSPNFCTLTGYQEDEVIGQNCRFLQAPGGIVARGDIRSHTSQEAVSHMRKNLLADKECQTTILNYKKNGDAFYNLVTIIPVPGGLTGEENEVVYQVGFQVSLNEQPNAILEKHMDGSYAVDYSSQRRPAPSHSLSPLNNRDRKLNAIRPVVMSKEFKRILGSSSFLRSFPIPTPGPTPSTNATSAEDAVVAGANNHLLHLFLLEANPDFYHVVSLKGQFLYVAPSVRRVLGYDSEEMVGTSISDYAHPEDVVPLMRELKESSAMGVTSIAGASTSSPSSGADASAAAAGAAALLPGPRPVDLLFRAKTKMGRYVWVQCRGRLHVEPGKGRKAIILVGRAREMNSLKHEDVNQAGGMAKPLRVKRPASGQPLRPSLTGKEKKASSPPPPPPAYMDVEQQAWGMLGGSDKENASFMSVSQGMEDILGWTSDDLLGTNILNIVTDEAARNLIRGFVHAMRTFQRRHRQSGTSLEALDDARWKKVRCRLRKKGGGSAEVWFVLYRADPEGSRGGEERRAGVRVDESRMTISSANLVYQIRLVEAETFQCGSSSEVLSWSSGSSPAAASSSSSSSTYVPVHSFSSPASSPKHPQSSSAAAVVPKRPSMDLFEELAIERGSSWQYEREQLRIANSKLMEEIAAFEEAERLEAEEEGRAEGHSGDVPLQNEELSPAQIDLSSPLQRDTSDLYEPSSSSSLGEALRRPPTRQQQQQQPLFSTQRLMTQQPCPPRNFPPLPPPSRQLVNSLPPPPLPLPLSLPPYLHQPQPQLSLQNVTQDLQVGASSMVAPLKNMQEQRRRGAGGFARLSLLQDPGYHDKEGRTMVPLPASQSSGRPPPLRAVYTPQSYIASPTGSSLKRPWHAIGS